MTNFCFALLYYIIFFLDFQYLLEFRIPIRDRGYQQSETRGAHSVSLSIPHQVIGARDQSPKVRIHHSFFREPGDDLKRNFLW